jgi:hypothetical protein
LVNLNKTKGGYVQAGRREKRGGEEATITLRDTLQKRNKRSLSITLHSHDVKKTLSFKLPNPSANRS